MNEAISRDYHPWDRDHVSLIRGVNTGEVLRSAFPLFACSYGLSDISLLGNS